MPRHSYPFPMYSGLLEQGHYKKIGGAIWLFLWCVSATTAEKEKDAIVWGIVLGNKPLQLAELAQKFGVSDKTVSRWINILEEYQYIRVTRAPRGLILSVRQSKKFAAPASDNSVRAFASDHTDLSDQRDKSVGSNKDITASPVVVVVEQEKLQLIQEIEQHFLFRRGRGYAVSPSDFEEIQRLVVSNVPLSLILTCIDRAFDEFKPRHSRDEIRSFNFVVPRILDAWEKLKATTAAVPPAAVAPGSSPRRNGFISKQQQELNELERLREEELKREQASAY
ncbi:HTH domain-containing protein [Paenibacillus pinisoli]|uniref:HTH domain-containing protein n=1 Tax=Paenibacillus pinisoli TaxID=1276110 RepID=A0A3A6PJZ2_9BACL|nr:HTH domain-containing protein [Paenibacillus pinisoli]RJX40066.1 HTH domain-containing protein [Paenibacillus pinisoli]